MDMMAANPMQGSNVQGSMEGMAPPGSGMQEQQPQMPGGPIGETPYTQEPVSADQASQNYLDFALSTNNIAISLKDKKLEDGTLLLDKMGQEVVTGYDIDEASRKGWMERNRDWLKLALLVRENKSWPWPKASNVKYPLVATAAMQFSARAYPALVPADGNVVKAKVVKKDKQGIFQKKAINVALHMSYQVMCKIPAWEEDMDKLLMTMAISGVCFKKTYHDKLISKHVSTLVYPEDLVVNYYAKSLSSAYRKTEILWYNPNELESKIRNDEEFMDQDYGPVQDQGERDTTRERLASETREPPTTDHATEHKFLAQHTYWDLDDDGYEEPYIIVVHARTKKVARIIARWDSDKLYRNTEGEIARIEPVEYFTDFPFIPNAEGSIYACGFGMLLGPLNEAVNTLCNQLIDSGTMSNLQAGFIGKNLRIKKGQVLLRPGEWVTVNATGEDLQKSFYPIPAKEPSAVLFQLMNLLITSGNQLASIAEIFVGKMPGQNTPATTTQETVQQSMAVFTAIYKRVYRSLHSEFKKIYRLNRITPNIVQEEAAYVDEPLQVSDYEGTEDFIIPGADPTGDSGTTRIQKLGQLQPMLAMGTIDPMAYTQRILEASEIPNYQELIAKPQPPQPDPKMQTEQLKQQGMQQKQQGDQALLDKKMQAAEADVEGKKTMAQIDAIMKANELRHTQQMDAIEARAKERDTQLDMVMKAITQHFDIQKGIGKVAEANAKSEAALNHQYAMNRIKQKQAKSTPAKKGVK